MPAALLFGILLFAVFGFLPDARADTEALPGPGVVSNAGHIGTIEDSAEGVRIFVARLPLSALQVRIKELSGIDLVVPFSLASTRIDAKVEAATWLAALQRLFGGYNTVAELDAGGQLMRFRLLNTRNKPKHLLWQDPPSIPNSGECIDDCQDVANSMRALMAVEGTTREEDYFPLNVTPDVMAADHIATAGDYFPLNVTPDVMAADHAATAGDYFPLNVTPDVMAAEGTTADDDYFPLNATPEIMAADHRTRGDDR